MKAVSRIRRQSPFLKERQRRQQHFWRRVGRQGLVVGLSKDVPAVLRAFLLGFGKPM